MSFAGSLSPIVLRGGFNIDFHGEPGTIKGEICADGFIEEKFFGVVDFTIVKPALGAGSLVKGELV